MIIIAICCFNDFFLFLGQRGNQALKIDMKCDTCFTVIILVILFFLPWKKFYAINNFFISFTDVKCSDVEFLIPFTVHINVMMSNKVSGTSLCWKECFFLTHYFSLDSEKGASFIKKETVKSTFLNMLIFKAQLPCTGDISRKLLNNYWNGS